MESDEREFASVEECRRGGDHDGRVVGIGGERGGWIVELGWVWIGADWWVSRWKLEIGGLPMLSMMVSLKIANDGFARWMW